MALIHNFDLTHLGLQAYPVAPTLKTIDFTIFSLKKYPQVYPEKLSN